MKFNNEQFAKLVKIHRGKDSLNIVSKSTGVSPATHHRVENGGKMDIDTFCKLCEWIGKAPSVFFTK